MWGYDKRRAIENELSNNTLLIKDLKERQMFVENLLSRANPNELGLTEYQKQIRILERFIIFEIFHETALSATKNSVLHDISRIPEIRQPFEIQLQSTLTDIEMYRIYNGNLRSGSSTLPLRIDVPTKIRYFFDRAPGFLNTVYNKIAWGFYESVFVERHDPLNAKYRTPENLAQAAINIFNYMDFPKKRIPTKVQLIKDINDRSGQPELYIYFALREKEDISHECHKKLVEEL